MSNTESAAGAEEERSRNEGAQRSVLYRRPRHVNPKGAVSGIKEMQEKIALNGVKDSQFFSVGFSGDHDA